MASSQVKTGECAAANYAIIVIDFVSRYCASPVNSANTHPNLKTKS